MQAEGPGWRLAVDSSRSGYQALIGGDGWAIELSLDELAQLKIALEQGPWWMELSGDRERWSLRFVLSCLSGRGAEGSWQPPASAELCLALAKAGSF